MKFPITQKSTLIIEHEFNEEQNRLRKRALKEGRDIGEGYCDNCGARLTEADVDEGCCGQCGDGIPEV